MKPGTLNIEIFAHATFQLPIQWLAAGVPVNLSDYKVRMQIRERASSATAALSLDNGATGGIVIENAEEGRIRVYVSDEQSGALTIKAGVYDVVAENPSGEAVRILQGTASVVPGVTKPLA